MRSRRCSHSVSGLRFSYPTKEVSSIGSWSVLMSRNGAIPAANRLARTQNGSRHRNEIGPAMAVNHLPKRLGCEYLDLVAPLVEMPGHFRPACRVKAYDQTAVVLRLKHLARVKPEPRRPFCCLGDKPPDHLTILRGVLPDAKGLGSITPRSQTHLVARNSR